MQKLELIIQSSHVSLNVTYLVMYKRIASVAVDKCSLIFEQAYNGIPSGLETQRRQ